MITRCASRFLTSVVLPLAILSAAKGLPGKQTSHAQAQEAASTPEKYSWKPEDVIFQELASEFLISPDNKWVVWVKSTGDKEKDERVSNLYLSSLSEKKRNRVNARSKHGLATTLVAFG